MGIASVPHDLLAELLRRGEFRLPIREVCRMFKRIVDACPEKMADMVSRTGVTSEALVALAATARQRSVLLFRNMDEEFMVDVVVRVLRNRGDVALPRLLPLICVAIRVPSYSVRVASALAQLAVAADDQANAARDQANAVANLVNGKGIWNFDGGLLALLFRLFRPIALAKRINMAADLVRYGAHLDGIDELVLQHLLPDATAVDIGGLKRSACEARIREPLARDGRCFATLFERILDASGEQAVAALQPQECTNAPEVVRMLLQRGVSAARLFDQLMQFFQPRLGGEAALGLLLPMHEMLDWQRPCEYCSRLLPLSPSAIETVLDHAPDGLASELLRHACASEGSLQEVVEMLLRRGARLTREALLCITPRRFRMTPIANVVFRHIVHTSPSPGQLPDDALLLCVVEYLGCGATEADAEMETDLLRRVLAGIVERGGVDPASWLRLHYLRPYSRTTNIEILLALPTLIDAGICTPQVVIEFLSDPDIGAGLAAQLCAACSALAMNEVGDAPLSDFIRRIAMDVAIAARPDTLQDLLERLVISAQADGELLGPLRMVLDLCVERRLRFDPGAALVVSDSKESDLARLARLARLLFETAARIGDRV